jgi:Wax ester synthase-like Acyl-CoA acyltransferase domain/WS/DGAT C-terminal domain
MNRLSALDASFIYGETSETPMNVGSLAILAAPANPDDVFARFRDHTAARLDLLPLYRRRLEKTPLGLDHPAWVDDDDLDLDYHIHRAALPKPGTMKQLRALVARLHAIPLDHTRPLWQYYLIEGLEDDGFAVYFKFHHCDMDGVALMATLDATYDFSPDSAPAPPLRNAAPPAAPPPHFLEGTTTAVADFLRQGFRAVGSLPGLARTVAKASRNLGRDAQNLLAYVWKTPRTRFNVAVSSHRSYGTDVSDPLVRLAATQVAAREAKDLLADVKDLLTADVSLLGAPTIMTALYQLLQRTNSAWWNVVISNVPGPRQPIYCAGAPARHYFPLSATDARLRAEHHGVWLCRSARVRIDRMPNCGARRATHRRLSGRGFRSDAARPRGAPQARSD